MKNNLQNSLRFPALLKNRGLSLVELMIAMTLGLVTVAAIGWIYLGTSKTYRTQDSLARLQEGARYAFELIGNDLRMAGARACSYSTEVNVIPNYDTSWETNFLEQPLVAEDKTGTGTETKFSDALRVLRADVGREYIVSSHNGTSAFTLTAAHDLQPGALMIATDCDHLAVFQASAASGSSVSHAFPLGTASAVKTFSPGSRLYQLSASTYYVQKNPAEVLSLYRLRPAGASATPTAEELIEGVDDLQVTFGVDLDAVPDGSVNVASAGAAYMTAEDITSATSIVPGATPEERWSRVVSVRVSLLMATVEDFVVPSAQTYSFNGADVDATDRRLRKVFTHVVKLRNR